jgi:hypothetical protein
MEMEMEMGTAMVMATGTEKGTGRTSKDYYSRFAPGGSFGFRPLFLAVP